MRYACIYIKYSFMLLCCFYLFNKLLHLGISKKTTAVSVLFSVLIPFPFLYVRLYIPSVSLFVLLSLFFTAVTVLYHIMLNTALLSAVISFGINCFFYYVSVLFAVPLLYLLSYWGIYKSFLYILSAVLIGSIQLILSTLPFYFQRYKKGMPFLQEQGAGDIGVFICLLIVMNASLSGLFPQNKPLSAVSIFTIIILGVLLFFWWKRSITQKYKRMLQKQETESLIHTNQSLQKEIQTLKKDNQALSKIIHKDNKLIPAMELAVRELLSDIRLSDTGSHLKNKADSLLQELRLLTEERKGILLSYEKNALYSVSSGLTRFDALVHYMSQKCHLDNIDFKVSLNADILYLTQHIIKETDLCTLTADLLENAIIACKNQPAKNILLVIGLENQQYYLSISDSGIPFQPDTIQLMGKNRVTTHADTGGSGIGLITTFEIAKKYKASFYIEEITNTSMYTKKISFRFDDLYIFNAYGNRITQ